MLVPHSGKVLDSNTSAMELSSFEGAFLALVGRKDRRRATTCLSDGFYSFISDAMQEVQVFLTAIKTLECRYSERYYETVSI